MTSCNTWYFRRKPVKCFSSNLFRDLAHMTKIFEVMEKYFRYDTNMYMRLKRHLNETILARNYLNILIIIYEMQAVIFLLYFEKNQRILLSLKRPCFGQFRHCSYATIFIFFMVTAQVEIYNEISHFVLYWETYTFILKLWCTTQFSI